MTEQKPTLSTVPKVEPKNNDTDINEFLSELNAGVYKDKVQHVLSQVALAVVNHGGKGKVTLEFDFKQINNSDRVHIDHKLKYTAPRRTGKFSEEDTTSTPMYVGHGGKITLFSETQNDMFER
ncbi:hypothetical protein [Catenovulum sediminis]|uniref:Uncharacterized protein n=1 Tax=Catenovulum sediminis TaxID=1740262 RepID=A0ABV1RKH8_9ALTE